MTSSTLNDYSITLENGRYYLCFDHPPLNDDIINFVYTAPVDCDSTDLAPLLYRQKYEVSTPASQYILPFSFDRQTMHEYVYLNGILLGRDDYRLDGSYFKFIEELSDGTTIEYFTATGDVIDFVYSTGIQIINHGGSNSDADRLKLDGIETGAQVNTVTSVNGSIGAVTVTTFSGDYGDLSNQPTIPTNNNELSNGAGYITDYTVTSADVIAHEGDITITESQISDLDTYLVAADITGKADLVGGKLDTSQIPDLAVTEYLGAVANETAMLALTGEKGDWCNRSDTGQMFIISGTDPTQLASWAAISYPASPVVSVAGKTGAVTLTHDDIGSGAVTATSATFSSRVDAVKFKTLTSGSALYPIICVGDDNDNGIFHPASNNIGFTTFGVERMRINDLGNVGIKQSNPDHLLHIGDTTNALGGTAGDQLDNLTIQSDTANTDYLNFTANRISTGIDWTTAAQRIQRKVDSTLMGYIQFGNFGSDLITFGEGNTEYGRFNGSGNFGIGTINPDKLLHVLGNNNPQIKVSEANNSTSAGLEIENQGQRNWQIWADRSTDQFRVGNNARASTNFAITSTGNVGIGTTSPQAKLDVNGTAFVGEGGEDNEILRLNTDRTWSFFQRGSGAQTSLDLASSDNKSFTISSLKTGETSASASVFIGGSDGNVGIGTTSPTQELDVNGTIEANDLTINGSSFRNIPKNSKTAAYTLLVSDLGKVVCITTGGVTIPSGVFSSGDAVTIYNDSGSNQTITQGSSVTLRTAGTSTAGNKTLAGYGLCTVLCVASNVFVVGGAGLS